MKSDLSGSWESQYTYSRGKSKHEIVFSQRESKLTGHSLPSEEDSKLFLELGIDKNILTGTWREKTSPRGVYKGVEFYGALQLLISKDRKKLSGAWIGFNNERKKVNCGEWQLKKLSGRTPENLILLEAKLYTDGGSRGNPGESAGAFVICKMDDNVVEKSGFYIGITTNNRAEYQALLQGLQRSTQLGIRRLKVFMDSELIVKQINGLYKIKNKDLEPLYRQVKKLAEAFEIISFTYVPRALNKEADTEVNRILDEQANKKSA